MLFVSRSLSFPAFDARNIQVMQYVFKVCPGLEMAMADVITYSNVVAGCEA
jgi:hypothetical protein